MKTIETFAEFDENGNCIIQNPPALKNKKVKLVILIEEEQNEFNKSSAGLLSVYCKEESDHDLTIIKEPNPDYECW